MDAETVMLLTAIGTLLTAGFTGYALMQHALERPRPRWSLSRSADANPQGDSGRWWLYVTATNIGDGDALNTRIVTQRSGVNDALMVSRSAAVASGEKLMISVEIAKRTPPEEDPYGDALSFPVTDLREIGDVGVTITWNHPPHRWWTRKRTYRVSRLEVR